VTVAIAGAGLPVTVWCAPPGAAVTVYEVMVAPPSLGAVQLSVADPLPPVPVTPVGAVGAVASVIDAEGSLAALSPLTFVATTVKV
jgi:hypothetical protein